MSSWRIFPEKAWRLVAGSSLSGFGKGEGAYGLGYAIETATGPFLNGRVSAQFQIARVGPIASAGVVARADDLRTFVACYVVSEDPPADIFGVRLAAFKLGRLEALVGLRTGVPVTEGRVHISLQAYSGEIVGQVVTGTGAYDLKYTVPEVPFPGYGGVLRFYDSSVMASNIHVEKIRMKPILPEVEGVKQPTHPFDVFLSHSSVDKPSILKVVEAFRSAGISYWVDHERLTFGDGIISKIEEGLKNSRFVVVCLSEGLAASGWCRAEYAPILYREFSGDTSRRVIPLSLDGSQNSEVVPLLLSDKVRADFTNKASFSAFLRFLREARAS